MHTVAFIVLLVIACSALQVFGDAFVHSGQKTLVLLDTAEIKESHSDFFEILKRNGLDLTFKQAIDSGVSFKVYGEFQYDNLILFAPNTDRISAVNSETLKEYAEAGHNIMIAAGTQLSEEIRTFASDVGVEYDNDENFVIDHFNYDTELDNGQHNVVIAKNMIENAVVLGDASLSPILFRGPGMKLSTNKFLLPIVRGSSTSYSAHPEEPDVHVAGEAVTLVAGLQARNGARVTFLGSLDMLSNRFFNSQITHNNAGKMPTKIGTAGNRDFAQQLAKWSFQQRGVLRHRNTFHHLKGMNETQYTYRINEDVVYNVLIEEWNGAEWVGFDADDVQLEFIMLDPWLRIPLKNQGQGLYVSEFKIPDVYGVYKFQVHYQRPGYSPLIFSDQVAIRPYRINEFERFIDMAYPYYASILSLVGGFFMFAFIFLYTPNECH